MSDTSVNAACAYTYTVKRGDSFYLIARRLGVPLRDLLNANPDIPPARLMVGDTLCIPSACDTPAQEPDHPAQEPDCPAPPPAPCHPDTPETPGTTCPENRRTVVAEGQTVADIQLAGNKSYHTLEAANPGLDLENLKTGDVVCVPALNLPCALPSTVTMAAGETLQSLAGRFNLTAGQLLRANPCLAPQDFREGTVVHLPQ